MHRARAGQSDKVVAGCRKKTQPPVIDAQSENEIYGVQLSERARRGESKPRMPEKRVANTRAKEAKKVPNTGVAKRRSGSTPK